MIRQVRPPGCFANLPQDALLRTASAKRRPGRQQDVAARVKRQIFVWRSAEANRQQKNGIMTVKLWLAKTPERPVKGWTSQRHPGHPLPPITPGKTARKLRRNRRPPPRA
jgi:hypothetical protein